MTTHDQQTVSGTYDEFQAPSHSRVEEAPQMNERTAQVDPSVAQADPAAGPSTAPTQPEAVSRPAEQPAAERETSTEEVLFADDELAELRGRWAGVQAAFVDDPKDCVQKADVLVSDLVDQLTSGFAHARSRLEEQWARGEEASTEDLRVALMHYREFFERLLAV